MGEYLPWDLVCWGTGTQETKPSLARCLFPMGTKIQQMEIISPLCSLRPGALLGLEFCRPIHKDRCLDKYDSTSARPS